MSTQDEEWAPQESIPPSSQPGEAEPEAGAASSTGTGESGDSRDASLSLMAHIDELVPRIRSAVEEKDWQTLAEAIGLDSVFIEGHPQKVTDIVERLHGLTTNLCDFEGVLLRVSKHEILDDSARFSFRFRVMWNSCDDWEDHDLYVDTHAGYTRTPAGWKLEYLSLSRAYPQTEQAPAKPAASARTEKPAAPPSAQAISEKPAATFAAQRQKRSRSRKRRRAASRAAAAPITPAHKPHPKPAAPAPAPPPPAAKTADQPLTDDYFSLAAAQYFGQVAPPAAPQAAKPQAMASSAGGKHHLLYVPVVMHEDLIKKILGND